MVLAIFILPALWRCCWRWPN